MTKSIKKKNTTKKVSAKNTETTKEEKMICITEKRAIILCIELSFAFGLLISWAIASFLIETNYFETELATSSLTWLFFPVLFVIIGLIIFSYILMCRAISQKK